MTTSNLAQSYIGFLYPQINNETYRTDILTQIVNRLDWMITRHNKVLAIRFDVRFPSGYVHNGNNVEISNLLRRLREDLEWNGIEVQYAWVREQVNSPVPHYHVAMFVDGSKIQNPMGILQEADRIWQHTINCVGAGLVDFCCHDGGVGHVMIRRPSSALQGAELEMEQRQFREGYDDAVRRVMYLAKTFSKGNTPHRVREFGCSQM